MSGLESKDLDKLYVSLGFCFKSWVFIKLFMSKLNNLTTQRVVWSRTQTSN